MFVKLFKHEFRATRNAMMVLCLTALGAGILGGGALGWLTKTAMLATELAETMDILCGLVLTFSILFIVMCGVGAFVLMLWRFYKSRFTDEGYLTFTLPVSGHQILLSGMVNSTINMLIAAVVVCLSFGLMFTIGCSFIEGFWAAVAERMPEIWGMMTQAMTAEYWGYVALGLLDMLVGFVSEMVIIMLAITLGAIVAKKHKILAAVGLYYGIHLALSFLSGTVISTGLVASNSIMGSFAMLMSSFALFFGVISAIGYFLTHYLITRKLNLP